MVENLDFYDPRIVDAIAGTLGEELDDEDEEESFGPLVAHGAEGER